MKSPIAIPITEINLLIVPEGIEIASEWTTNEIKDSF